MYGLYIVIENADARRDRVGPFTAEMRETVSTYAEAHAALDRILELMGIHEPAMGRGSAMDWTKGSRPEGLRPGETRP